MLFCARDGHPPAVLNAATNVCTGRSTPVLAAGLLVLTTFLAPVPAAAADPSNGASIYRTYCVMCHGANGRNVMPGAPDFRDSRALFQSDQALLRRIEQGQGACPSYLGVLRRTEILDLISHLRMMY